MELPLSSAGLLESDGKMKLPSSSVGLPDREQVGPSFFIAGLPERVGGLGPSCCTVLDYQKEEELWWDHFLLVLDYQEEEWNHRLSVLNYKEEKEEWGYHLLKLDYQEEEEWGHLIGLGCEEEIEYYHFPLVLE